MRPSLAAMATSFEQLSAWRQRARETRANRLRTALARCGRHGAASPRTGVAIASLQPSTRVAIVGSRDFPQLDAVEHFVDNLPPNTIVVSGHGRGVDTVAEERALSRGLETLIFRPNWPRHGRKAGFLRNRDIVNACDRLVAFWDGVSKGTADSISLARQAGKPVAIFYPSPAPGPDTPARSS